MDNDITKKTVCDFCAFMLTEDQSTEATARLIESKYRTIREVQNAPKKIRHLSVGGLDDRTETCFIGSPTWIKREDDVHCSDRLDNSLSLEAALALRESRLSNNIARAAKSIAFDAKIWAITAAIIATIAIAMPIVLEWLSKN